MSQFMRFRTAMVKLNGETLFILWREVDGKPAVQSLAATDPCWASALIREVTRRKNPAVFDENQFAAALKETRCRPEGKLVPLTPAEVEGFETALAAQETAREAEQKKKRH